MRLEDLIPNLLKPIVRPIYGRWKKRRIEDALRHDLRTSEEAKETLEAWWDGAQTGVRSSFWLTDSKGPEVWEYLKIADRIYAGQVILNIGIGTGRCTRELVKRGCKVHALDISRQALKTVESVVERAWWIGELPTLPEGTFDVAISNLVSQHMSNQDLLDQLRAVIRSLKPSGVFAMQFAYPLNGTIPSDNEDYQRLKAGGVLRTLSGMRTMVESVGGRVTWAEEIGQFRKHGGGWYGVHIQRREAS